jgi:hypothetical protein
VSVIHKLINSIWNEEEMPDQSKEFIIAPVHKKGDETVIIIVEYHWYRQLLWSSDQSFWLLTQRSRVRFPALPDFLSSSGSGTGSTQPCEYK